VLLEKGHATDDRLSDENLDVDQVRRLYEIHGRALFAYACAFVRDPSDAEDVVQEVFLRLLRGVATGSLSPGYLFRAVRNGALNDIRRRSREVDLDGGVQWLESSSDSSETALALQSALRVLPEEQREVVVLRVWGQLTFDEIAGVMDISPNTAASRYRYGLMKLKEVWHG
jgi:RNA polymerase sigma-70 factor (ECF subfamily)